MIKQILAMHGGNVFRNYDEYLSRLQTKEMTMDRMREGGWRRNLKVELGKGYDVLTPRMPNAENAKYVEWKIWFEKMIPLLNDEIILIGHSLGGLFFAKFLSENVYPKKISALLLVAAPHNGQGNKHSDGDNFVLNDDLKKIVEQVSKVYFFHSKDDAIVPFSDFEIYKTKLPTATFVPFESRGHFNQETFPEIVEVIKGL